MDIIQATYKWENFKYLLDKNNQYIYNYQDSNIINQIAIEFVKILLNNNVVNLKFNNNDIFEFIQYFHTNIISKEFIDKITDNILINEFNSNIINDIDNFSNCINNVISNIHNNIYNNNIISKFLYNLININSFKHEKLIDNTNRIENINPNYNNKLNSKSKFNRNLNDLQRIILDNMSIIHDSLNPNLYFKKKLGKYRYNSFPKSNRQLVQPITPNLENIHNQISKYIDTGQSSESINLDIIKANEYKSWYGYKSNIIINKDITKFGKILYKNKINSNKNSQLKIRINNIFRIDPYKFFGKKFIKRNNNNFGPDIFIIGNKNITLSNIRSKSPSMNTLGKTLNSIIADSIKFKNKSLNYKNDFTNSLKCHEINISLYRKNSA